MLEETKKLTKLHPKLSEFQAELREKYAVANKTAKKDQIVFVGSSLMEIFPIEKMQAEQNLGLDKIIYNRGIRATTTADLLAHIDLLILDLAPSKVFINIGSNDIGFNVPEATFLTNYAAILQQIKEKLPNTEVYVMAYYPVNPEVAAIDGRNNEVLATASTKVAALAKDAGYEFINLNTGLTDENGYLRADFTFDGAHMYPAGYEVVLANMQQYLK